MKCYVGVEIIADALFSRDHVLAMERDRGWS